MVCHIDVLWVWGRDQEEHDVRLHSVLQKLEKASVTLNMDKCELSKSKVVFLGHVITASGISPISEMEEPTNVSELRSFLAMVNQVDKFIPQLPEKDKAFHDLLSKKNCWVSDTDQVKAFKVLKYALSNRKTNVSADTSYGLRGVLLQKLKNECSLSPTEQRYVQVEKEALGLSWAWEHFQDFLLGKHFCLETDNKPLLSLLGTQALNPLPPRMQCFRMRLMSYSYSIVHILGKSLWTVDTWSRSPVQACMTQNDRELMDSTNICGLYHQ